MKINNSIAIFVENKEEGEEGREERVAEGQNAPPTSNGHAIPAHVHDEVPSKRRRKAPAGPGANPQMLRWLGH